MTQPNPDLRTDGKDLNVSREDRFLRDKLVFTPNQAQLGGLTLVIEPPFCDGVRTAGGCEASSTTMPL